MGSADAGPIKHLRLPVLAKVEIQRLLFDASRNSPSSADRYSDGVKALRTAALYRRPVAKVAYSGREVLKASS